MTEDNVFDYFFDEINGIFNLNESKLSKLIQIFNKKGINVTVHDFADICDYDILSGEADRYFIANSAYLQYYKLHNDEFETTLENSKLDSLIKTKLKDFIRKLNENGITGLVSRYYLEKRSFDDPSLSELSHDRFLKEIHNDNGELICYIPISRLKFSFESDGKESIRYAYFSQDKLKIFMDTLTQIYQDNKESIQKFKNINTSSTPIIGE